MPIPAALKVLFHHVSERDQKLIVNCLKKLRGPTRLPVVAKAEAHLEVFDIDLSASLSLLEKRLTQYPDKPIVVLSLDDVLLDNIFYLKKPLQSKQVIEVLQQVMAMLELKSSAGQVEPPNASDASVLSDKSLSDAEIQKSHDNAIENYLKESDSLDDVLGNADTEIDSGGMRDNQRKAIRYAFSGLSGYFEVSSWTGRHKRKAIVIVDISSKGALIECEEGLKLKIKGKLVLEFHLGTAYRISGQVVRADGSTYGVLFDKYNHKLNDYLIESGREFMIKGDLQLQYLRQNKK